VVSSVPVSAFPVFDSETGNPTELTGVVGHEDKVVRPRGGVPERVESTIVSLGGRSAAHSLKRPCVPQIDRLFPETTACSRPGRVRRAGGGS